MNDFFLVCCYTPNSQDGLKRLEYRMSWEDDFRAYLKRLDEKKPVILCGDLNVAHEEIDLKNPKTNRMNAGFTDQEREKFSTLLASGFIDTFRTLYPEQVTYYMVVHTVFRHVRKTQDGVSTISSPASDSLSVSKMPKFTRKS